MVTLPMHGPYSGLSLSMHPKKTKKNAVRLETIPFMSNN
jgi:hypothetical protein